MPIGDWDVTFELITPEGSLFFNEPAQAEGLFLLDKAGCESGTEVRATADNVPQSDGSILHRGFLSGYATKFAMQYWAGIHLAACATTEPTSQSMNDLLGKHLRSILNGGGRLLYNPTGEPRRLIDDVRLIERLVVVEGDGLTGCSFTLASPFPYAIDFQQTLTQLSAGDPDATLDNDGSSPFFPVFKVYGPFDTFELENANALDDAGNPMRIVYSSALPGAVAVGGGHYIEIDCFRNTVYLDGDGPSRKAGINIIESDFFPLVVGDNLISISGGGSNAAPDVDILWNPAWF